MAMTLASREERMCALWGELVELFPGELLAGFFSDREVNANRLYNIVDDCYHAWLTTHHTLTNEDQTMPTDDNSIEMEKAAIAARLRVLYESSFHTVVNAVSQEERDEACNIINDLEHHFGLVNTAIRHS